MIKFQNVEKFFGRTLVLNDVSGHVPKGSVIALLGPSGSGKSTLLRCFNLLERPDNGKIFVTGIDILNPACNIRKVREKVGIVFQHFHLFPNMTVLENITYAPCKVFGKSREEADTIALDLLKQVGLIDKGNVYPDNLSGGQKQRVAIVRALAANPEIMLFDEPTSALDPEMVKEVLDTIKLLVKSHLTVVIVTHEMQFAREIADEIWFLDQGKILERTPPKEFFIKPQSLRAQEFLAKIL